MKNSHYDILAIGGSAGSIDVLMSILPQIPEDYALAVVVVVHFPPDGKNLMPNLISDRVSQRAVEVDDKEPILPGRIYFAPPNYHLLIEKSRTFALNTDSPVQYSRPSIDVLFESVAEVYGQRAAGLILSGANEDGAHGLFKMYQAGAMVAVQDPAESRSAMMPQAAINLIPNIRRLGLSQIQEFMMELSESRRLP